MQTLILTPNATGTEDRTDGRRQFGVPRIVLSRPARDNPLRCKTVSCSSNPR